MAILDPHGEGRSGDIEASALTFPGSSQMLSSASAAPVAPAGHAVNAAETANKDCLATHELAHANQQFMSAPAGRGTSGQQQNSRHQGPRKGKGQGEA
jgi:hypothetical protein